MYKYVYYAAVGPFLYILNKNWKSSGADLNGN